MQSEISPKLLRPHQKNAEYYADLPDEKYAEVKRSIEVNGIRDPLKILPDYTILSGHQRLKIALELGLDRVPVEIKDVPEEDAEYLLIADNEERRQSDNDPIRKAKRDKFIMGYWKNLGRQNVTLKSTSKIAREAGYDNKREFERSLKLNDLIPELQILVSSGKIGTTAAEQLAYLTPDVQGDLFTAMGESLADLSVAATKDLRKKLEDQEAEKVRLASELNRAKEEAESAKERVAAVEEELADAYRDLADTRDKVDGLKEEAQAESAKKVAELESRIAKMVEAKKKADAYAIEVANHMTDLNIKLGEAKAGGAVIEKQVRYAEDVKRIQDLEKEIADLKAKPVTIPADYEKIKTQLRQKEEVLLNLTKAQAELTDRYKVKDAFFDLARDLGKNLKRIQMQIGDRVYDPEVCESALSCISVLNRTITEIKSMIGNKGGNVVEGDFAGRKTV